MVQWPVSPRLLRHASRLLGDIDHAQDAVQDAWVNAARGLRRLEDPARFPAWMFALVSRRCADRDDPRSAGVGNAGH